MAVATAARADAIAATAGKANAPIAATAARANAPIAASAARADGPIAATAARANATIAATVGRARSTAESESCSRSGAQHPLEALVIAAAAAVQKQASPPVERLFPEPAAATIHHLHTALALLATCSGVFFLACAGA